MFTHVIAELQQNACPAIQYRLQKEILDQSPDFTMVQPQILADKRVQYVMLFINGVFISDWR